jgi:Beta-ketoacyl synthase, N-terminal domain
MTPLFISQATDYVERIDDDVTPVDLKPLVLDATGLSVRRIDRFIQLALIGAARSVRDAKPDRDTAVYLGSGRGDLEVIIGVMQSLLRDGQPPKPLSFINTVSNASCYYVAQSLNLTGRSSFVCNRYFAFESVLELASLDVASGEVGSALIGTVDVVVPPLSGHRLRLDLDPSTPVADASHWLLVRKDDEGALCQLLAVESFIDRAAFEQWLNKQPEREDWVVATGQFMSASEAREWATSMHADVFDYRSDRPYYDSHSGAVINAYASSDERRPLLHVNRDPSGRYSAMVVSRN